jgi:hypothetical protein
MMPTAARRLARQASNRPTLVYVLVLIHVLAAFSVVALSFQWAVVSGAGSETRDARIAADRSVPDARVKADAATSMAVLGLGNYPNTTVNVSANTTVTPDAAPADAVRINVSTSTNFKCTFAADPATGVVRVTNAHPLGRSR